jgi:hypothetical protein
MIHWRIEMMGAPDGRPVLRRLGVHVLGAADLDVAAAAFSAEMEAVGAIASDPEAVWARLTRKPQLVSSTGKVFTSTPLQTVLSAGCDALLLVGTRQLPRH